MVLALLLLLLRQLPLWRLLPGRPSDGLGPPYGEAGCKSFLDTRVGPLVFPSAGADHPPPCFQRRPAETTIDWRSQPINQEHAGIDSTTGKK